MVETSYSIFKESVNYFFDRRVRGGLWHRIGRVKGLMGSGPGNKRNLEEFAKVPFLHFLPHFLHEFLIILSLEFRGKFLIFILIEDLLVCTLPFEFQFKHLLINGSDPLEGLGSPVCEGSLIGSGI